MSTGAKGSGTAEFDGGGIYATKLGFYLFWMEYLAVSPSYELARRYRQGETIAPESLPADFDKVLAVYDDLGDVQRAVFVDWWREKGLKHFGFQSERPRIRRLGTLTETKADPAPLHRALDRYVSGKWVEEARQPTMLVAIPLGLTKAKLTRQLASLLDKVDASQRQLKPAPPKYALYGKRQRVNTLVQYLRVLWMRSSMPDKELWRVGVSARVSPTYSRELAEDATPAVGEATYDRMMLTVMTSRAYQRAVLIAENAARGKFPTYEPCPHAIQPDLRALFRLVSARVRWKKAMAKQAKASGA